MDIANDLMTKNDFSPAIVYIDQSYSSSISWAWINEAGADIGKVWKGRERLGGNIWVSHKINMQSAAKLFQPFLWGQDLGGMMGGGWIF